MRLLLEGSKHGKKNKVNYRTELAHVVYTAGWRQDVLFLILTLLLEYFLRILHYKSCLFHFRSVVYDLFLLLQF
jgi:hypothetical protein